MLPLWTRDSVSVVVLLSAIVLVASCKRKPVWKQDFKSLLDKTNHELESTITNISQDSPPDAVLAGFSRLDRAGDQMIADLESFLNKYPDIMQERVTIWLQLGSELKQLGNNLRTIIAAGNFWEKKFGTRGEFYAVTRSILRKGKRIENLLREAGND